MFDTDVPMEVDLLGHATVRGMGRIVQLGSASFIRLHPEGTDSTDRPDFYSLHSAVFAWRRIDPGNLILRSSRTKEDIAAAKALFRDASGGLSWCLAQIPRPAIGTAEHDAWGRAQDLLYRLEAAGRGEFFAEAPQRVEPTPPHVADDDDIPF